MPEDVDLLGHDLDEDDDHDPDACYRCLSQREPVASACRCGECCRSLLIEVRLEDAEREPRIKELGSPILTWAEFSENGERQLIGYLLNSREKGGACAFLDETTNLCTIHQTRPLVCRLFDCEEERKERLMALAIVERPEMPNPQPE